MYKRIRDPHTVDKANLYALDLINFVKHFFILLKNLKKNASNKQINTLLID